MSSSVSAEAFKRAFARDDDLGSATLTVGSNVTTVAPCAYIEWLLSRILEIVRSESGCGLMDFGDGADTVTVLITSSTPVSAKWPSGYSPFERPNPLIDGDEHH